MILLALIDRHLAQNHSTSGPDVVWMRFENSSSDIFKHVLCDQHLHQTHLTPSWPSMTSSLHSGQEILSSMSVSATLGVDGSSRILVSPWFSVWKSIAALLLIFVILNNASLNGSSGCEGGNIFSPFVSRRFCFGRYFSFARKDSTFSSFRQIPWCLVKPPFDLHMREHFKQTWSLWLPWNVVMATVIGLTSCLWAQPDAMRTEDGLITSTANGYQY